MKKQMVLFPGILLAFGFIVAGCTSLTPETVKSGDGFWGPFLGGKDFSDSSIPLEEQCALINLGQMGLAIERIDGESGPFGASAVSENEIVILSPGKHTLEIVFTQQNFTVASWTSSSAEGGFSGMFEPGHYYFLTGGKIDDKTAGYQIDDLANHDEVTVYPSALSSFTVPAQSVIEGIKARVQEEKR